MLYFRDFGNFFIDLRMKIFPANFTLYFIRVDIFVPKKLFYQVCPIHFPTFESQEGESRSEGNLLTPNSRVFLKFFTLSKSSVFH